MSGRHHGPGQRTRPRRWGPPGGPLGRRPATADAPRRRPRRAAGPARRAAAHRLQPHGGDRASQQRRLAPEPGLGLPDAAAARGRRARPRRGRRGPHAVHPERRRQGLRRGEPRGARRALGQAGRGRRRGAPRAPRPRRQIGAATLQVAPPATRAGRPRQGAARADAPRPLPDPGRRARAGRSSFVSRRGSAPGADRQLRSTRPQLARSLRFSTPSGSPRRPRPNSTGCVSASAPPGSAHAQPQLERAQPATSPSGAEPQLERPQLERV